jgi:hypothetical protein
MQNIVHNSVAVSGGEGEVGLQQRDTGIDKE